MLASDHGRAYHRSGEVGDVSVLEHDLWLRACRCRQPGTLTQLSGPTQLQWAAVVFLQEHVTMSAGSEVLTL